VELWRSVALCLCRGATLIFETELVEIVDAPPASEPEDFGGEDEEGFEGEDGEEPLEE